jgi:hypothetical protein
MASRIPFDDAPLGLARLRARVWLGLTQLGSGDLRDAHATFVAARGEWRDGRPQGEARQDPVDAQLTDWIVRAAGN